MSVFYLSKKKKKKEENRTTRTFKNSKSSRTLDEQTNEERDSLCWYDLIKLCAHPQTCKAATASQFRV